ncbi:NB-ARC domain-containing protein [Dactylosporangium sp. CA-233914]|uniref:NB-ARC domain-containing protein n=1 Tax=Dactylosporangium sp. CA-233914 TaxID=3239934 RepID=UPI003D8CE39C
MIRRWAGGVPRRLAWAAVAAGVAGGGAWAALADGKKGWTVVAASVAAVVGAFGPSVSEWWRGRIDNELPAPPAAVPVANWVVPRQRELDDVIRALRRGRREVGITTALHGAGGFGKTTLAAMVCDSSQVRRQFRGHIYQITIGSEARTPILIASKVNELAELITGVRPGYVDPQAAGQHLSRVLDHGPSRLVVLDDVWEADQLVPFLHGGPKTVRLVTTRIPSALPPGAHAVLVDQMSRKQARQVLTFGLPGLPPMLTKGMLDATGRWPLLLRLSNRVLADRLEAGVDITAAARELLAKLHEAGPAAVDSMRTDPVELNLHIPTQRARAVRATVEASTGLLHDEARARLLELGIFAEDEQIPVELVARLWAATSGMAFGESAGLCARLGRLSLVTLTTLPNGGPTIGLHDIIRAFLRNEIGPDALGRLNATLVDAIAADLPRTAAGHQLPGIAWWQMRADDRYQWDNLVGHLVAAARHGEAEALALDLRWHAIRLPRFGPASLTADLAAVRTPDTATFSRTLSRMAHLLGPTNPEHAVFHILLSRLRDDPAWHDRVVRAEAAATDAMLVNRWPLPDAPNDALLRIIPGNGMVAALAVNPADNVLLVADSLEQAVRFYDPATGSERGRLPVREQGVHALAVAGDGSWLAIGGNDVLLWDMVTATESRRLSGQYLGVRSLAASPDGRWLAVGDGRGTIHVWDLAADKKLTELAGHKLDVFSLAVSGDGTWLASGGRNGIVKIWDTARWTESTHLSLGNGAVRALAISPDDTWLATGDDETSRIWDTTTWTETARLDSPASHLAVAPDGSWLAGAGRRMTIVWDVATWRERARFATRMDVVSMTIATDGRWVATGDPYGAVFFWDAASGGVAEATTARTDRVHHLVVTRDGSHIAAVATGNGRTWGFGKPEPSRHSMRIWDATGAEPRLTLEATLTVRALAASPDGGGLVGLGHEGSVVAWNTSTWEWTETKIRDADSFGPSPKLAVSPDGVWIATTCDQVGTVLIWKAAGWVEHARLPGVAENITDMAFAPDGAWLAVSSWHSSIRIWDTRTWTKIANFADGDSSVWSLDVAPDGAWLAAVNYGSVEIWDTADWVHVRTLDAEERGMHELAISPDGAWIAGTGPAQSTGAIEVWDVASGTRATIMRVDGSVGKPVWLPGSSTIAVPGSAGVYLFEFRPAGADELPA